MKSILKTVFFFIPFLSFILFIIIIVYMCDPLQIMHKGFFDANKYDASIRVQAKGIIDNIDFDSVICGTSIFENTSAAQASCLLKERFVNISISGSNFRERYIVLKYLLRHKKIKSIIYSLDIYKYIKADKTLGNPGVIFERLYSDSLWQYQIYYDKKAIKKSLDAFFYKPKQRLVDWKFFDRPNRWDTNPRHSSRFGGLDNWVKNRDKQGLDKFMTVDVASAAARSPHFIPKLIYDSDKIKQAIHYLDIYIVSLAKEHKNTKFYLIFPPYYRYYFSYMRYLNPYEYTVHQEVVKYLAKISKELKNIYIFGYEDTSYLDDISHYKDLFHYDTTMNDQFLTSIYNMNNLITVENVEAYNKKAEEKSIEFSIEKFNSTIKDKYALLQNR